MGVGVGVGVSVGVCVGEPCAPAGEFAVGATAWLGKPADSRGLAIAGVVPPVAVVVEGCASALLGAGVLGVAVLGVAVLGVAVLGHAVLVGAVLADAVLVGDAAADAVAATRVAVPASGCGGREVVDACCGTARRRINRATPGVADSVVGDVRAAAVRSAADAVNAVLRSGGVVESTLFVAGVTACGVDTRLRARRCPCCKGTTRSPPCSDRRATSPNADRRKATLLSSGADDTLGSGAAGAVAVGAVVRTACSLLRVAIWPDGAGRVNEPAATVDGPSAPVGVAAAPLDALAWAAPALDGVLAAPDLPGGVRLDVEDALADFRCAVALREEAPTPADGVGRATAPPGDCPGVCPVPGGRVGTDVCAVEGRAGDVGAVEGRAGDVGAVEARAVSLARSRWVSIGPAATTSGCRRTRTGVATIVSAMCPGAGFEMFDRTIVRKPRGGNCGTAAVCSAADGSHQRGGRTAMSPDSAAGLTN